MRGISQLFVAALALAAALSFVGAASADPERASVCGEGPARVGTEIVGTPCADLIVVGPGVTAVRAGAGNDVIVPAAEIAAVASCPGPDGCGLGVGSQTFEGGPGDDIVFGERGNDRLYGNEGNDRLYGGIGDDELYGGPGDDILAGGFGADWMDGEAGNDYIRGDSTIDKQIADSGGDPGDTVSYSTGVTPGFPMNNNQFAPYVYPDFSAVAGFPSASGERGAFLNLANGIADNGLAPNGGGVEVIAPEGFETIVGTPFSDYIVGSDRAETIHGGGGADVIFGGGGDDVLHGGADGDHLDGGDGVDSVDGGLGANLCPGAETAQSCGTDAGATPAVVVRDKAKITAGLMAPGLAAPAQIYLVGSEGPDQVVASYSPTAVTFALGGDTPAAYEAGEGCTAQSSSSLVCPLKSGLDSVVIAGVGGDDTLTATGFPATAAVMILGGEGDDNLTGGDQSEDIVVDGPGADVLRGGGRDDALTNNSGGRDTLFGDGGNDLLLSDSLCEGDALDGGADRDNASWSKLKEPVEARLSLGIAGRPAGGSAPLCQGGTIDSLKAIEDLEGSDWSDVFFGDDGPNQLLGRKGADTYFAGGDKDRILANDGVYDPLIDCGDGGEDLAIVDKVPPDGPGDAAPSGCETIAHAVPDDFRLPVVDAPATEETKKGAPLAAAPDRKPPRTYVVRRPRPLVRTTRAVVEVKFAFASTEFPSRFRCRLDRRPFRPCAARRSFLVRPGRHVLVVYAIDRAGNRDRTPVRVRFEVRRVSGR